jgi:hypothetical protein
LFQVKLRRSFPSLEKHSFVNETGSSGGVIAGRRWDESKQLNSFHTHSAGHTNYALYIIQFEGTKFSPTENGHGCLLYMMDKNLNMGAGLVTKRNNWVPQNDAFGTITGVSDKLHS